MYHPVTTYTLCDPARSPTRCWPLITLWNEVEKSLQPCWHVCNAGLYGESTVSKRRMPSTYGMNVLWPSVPAFLRPVNVTFNNTTQPRIPTSLHKYFITREKGASACLLANIQKSILTIHYIKWCCYSATIPLTHTHTHRVMKIPHWHPSNFP